MSTRADHYLAQVEATQAELIATLTACTDEQWRRRCGGETWPVGVVAHHIGVVTEAMVGLVTRFAAGEPVGPAVSWPEIHQSNAQHARDFAEVEQRETLELLQATMTDFRHVLRGFTDEQFDQLAAVFAGNEQTLGQVVEWNVVGHTQGHLASIRDAIAARDAVIA